MFKVAKTFDVVTHESASRGDFAESGYVFEAKPMTLRLLQQFTDQTGADTKYVQDCVNNVLDSEPSNEVENHET